MRASSRKLIVACLGTLWAAAAAQAVLSRLPPKHTFPRGEGSPGPVIFNHATHVNEFEPDCLACHPSQFAILEKGKAVALPAIKHSAMDQGRACGACHGRKKAFSLTKCDRCHGDEE